MSRLRKLQRDRRPLEKGSLMVPAAELRITVSRAGKLSVHGPIGNKPLCLEMIEKAREALEAYQPPPLPAAPAALGA